MLVKLEIKAEKKKYVGQKWKESCINSKMKRNKVTVKGQVQAIKWKATLFTSLINIIYYHFIWTEERQIARRQNPSTWARSPCCLSCVHFLAMELSQSD